MPLPLPLDARANARQGGSNAPPPPEPSVWEQIGPNARIAIDETSDARKGRIEEAYRRLAEAAEEAGAPRAAMRRQAAPFAIDPAWFGADTLDYEKVWQAAQRAGIKEAQGNRAEFDLGTISRGGARGKDQAVVSRGRGVGSFVAAVPGYMAVDIGNNDAVGPLSLMLGGAGKTIGKRVLTEGLVQMGIAGAMLPEIYEGRKALGEPMSAAEIALRVGAAGVGGVVIRGGLEGAVPAAAAVGRGVGNTRGAIEQAVASNWERIPEPLRQRWANRATVKVGDDDVLLADIAEAAIGRGSMTDAELAAATQLRRTGEIEAANPFVPDGAGLKEHVSRLAMARAALSDPVPDPGEARLVQPRPRAPGAVVPREPGARPFAGKPLDPDSALGFIVDSLEGGAKLVRDSGGLTKYGISANAHPGVDVAGLTREGAMAIYRRQYWKPLGLDRAPADTAMVALDTAVNHGVAFARKILRASGGDPAQMIALRRAEYARLIAANPKKYGDYAKGWSNRLDRLGQRTGLRGDGDGAPPVRGDDGELARLDGEAAALAAERQAIDAERTALRAVDGDEAPVSPPPTLRADMFPDEPSWRAAQAELDRSFYGEPEAAAAVWRRSGVLADIEEGGVRAEQVRAVIGDEAADRVEIAATGFREGRVSEADALAALDDAALARLERFDAATANPSEREGFFLTPEGEERSLADVVADLDQGELTLPAAAPARAASAPAPGKVLQVIETDTGRVVETFREGVSRADAEDFAKRASQWTGPVGKTKTKYHVGEADGAPAPAAITRQQAADREALAVWDDPAGPAAQAQAGSVLHDLKAASAADADPAAGVAVQLDGEGGPVRLDAMLDEIDEDFAIVAAIKGCL